MISYVETRIRFVRSSGMTEFGFDELKTPLKVGYFYKTRGGIKAKCVHVFENGEAVFVDPDKFSIQASNFWRVRAHGRMRDDAFNHSYDLVSEWHEMVTIAPALVVYANGPRSIPYQTEYFYSSKEEAEEACKKNGNKLINWPAYEANWPKIRKE